MTTLFSLYSNPRHTMLVNTSGDVIYKVNTEKGVSSIMRAGPKKIEGEEQEFTVTGELNWNRPLTFKVGDGKPIPSSQFLRIPISDSKVKRLLKLAEENDKREFTDSTGTIYQWTLMGATAKLRRKGIPEPIATFQMERAALVGTDTRATLLLEPEALERLDLVVLTWVQVALLLNAFRSKGMFASIETEWSKASAGVDSATDY